MVDFYTRYYEQLEFTASHPRQLTSALLAKLGDVLPKRKRKKYAYSKSVWYKQVKACPVPDDIKLLSKCNFPDAG